MSEPDPMSAAISEALRKGGSLATLTAALITLMVRMLREHQRQADLQRPAAPARTVVQAAPAAERNRSMHDQVFTHLPEPMARALTTSDQFPSLATALTELQTRGGDVGAFLRAAGPVLAREQSRTRPGSTTAGSAAPATPLAPAPAPADRDGPGLRERARNAWAAFTARDAAPGDAGLTPDDEAWAVITAVYACGIDDARRLTESPGWPRLAQDIVTLGYAHQHGFTDLEPARILEDAYRAMPTSVGLDWPTAASAAFTRAREQFRHDTPRDAQPGTDRAHAARATSPATAPEQPTGTAAPSGTRGDPVAPPEDGADVSAARAHAAAARSGGVAPDARMHVVEHPDAPQQPAATSPARGQSPSR
jgi:hypothetical protein